MTVKTVKMRRTLAGGSPEREIKQTFFNRLRLEEYKPALPDSIGNLYNPTKTENESFDTISEAKKILETSLYGDMRNRLKDVLATQSSPLDTKNLFDDIDDDKITKSIPVAESVIETNKKSGLDVSKYPYLKDGLTMMYAAGEAGNSREMQKAKKAAYMPLTGNIGDLKAITENAVLKGKSLAEPMKTETWIYTPGKDGDAGMTLYSEKLNFSDGKDKSSNPDGAGKREEPQKGVRFLGENLKSEENSENESLTDEKNDEQYPSEEKVKSEKDLLSEEDPEQKEKEQNNSFYDDFQEKSKSKSTPMDTTMKAAQGMSRKERKEKWDGSDFSIDVNGETCKPSSNIMELSEEFFDEYTVGKSMVDLAIDENMLKALRNYLSEGVKNATRPSNIGEGVWAKQVANDLAWIDNVFGDASKAAKALKVLGGISIAVDVGKGISDNVKAGESGKEIAGDIAVDVTIGAIEGAAASWASSAFLGSKAGAALGSGIPVAGNIAGALVGALAGIVVHGLFELDLFGGKSASEILDDWADKAIDGIVSWFK